jgi:hypothetical protein
VIHGAVVEMPKSMHILFLSLYVHYKHCKPVFIFYCFQQVMPVTDLILMQIDTKDILFICGGAFVDLEKTISERYCIF